MKILIDPGHGGPDPGACANGIRECDYVLGLSRLLMNALRMLGHSAHLTRAADFALGNDKGSDLAARCHIEQSWGPDVFISVHCNASTSPASGFEVWTSVGETQADQVAENILNAFHNAFPLRPIRRDMSDGDGDWESNFYVLRNTRCPAVLVECGFLTNTEEAAWLKDNQTAIATALANGLNQGV